MMVALIPSPPGNAVTEVIDGSVLAVEVAVVVVAVPVAAVCALAVCALLTVKAVAAIKAAERMMREIGLPVLVFDVGFMILFDWI